MLGGEGEIRTRARCYTPNPLAGDPLGPLGYFSMLASSFVKTMATNYYVASQPTQTILAKFLAVVNLFDKYFIQ